MTENRISSLERIPIPSKQHWNNVCSETRENLCQQAARWRFFSPLQDRLHIQYAFLWVVVWKQGNNFVSFECFVIPLPHSGTLVQSTWRKPQMCIVFFFGVCVRLQACTRGCMRRNINSVQSLSMQSLHFVESMGPIRQGYRAQN